MSGPTIERQPEDLITEHDPAEAGAISRWICMDDRPADIDGLYRQIGGGAFGAAQDAIIASELSKRGSVLGLGGRGRYESETVNNVPRVHEAAGALALLGERDYDVRLLLHEDCKAEDGAQDVAGIIADPERREELLKTAIQFYPEIDATSLENVAEVTAAMVNQGVIADRRVAAAAMGAGSNWKGHDTPPIGRVPLFDMPHVSGIILANYKTGTAFDSRTAMGDPTSPDRPAYHVSFGDLGEIAVPAREMFDGTRRFFTDLLASSAVRHAAIALSLPRPTGKPLEVRLVEDY